MNLEKSSRHSKITGDFSESLILYWLSKYGFECAKVDHIGLDLIARNPKTNELMGISVKSRSRSTGTERGHLKITNDNFSKIDKACKSFWCIAYYALVVDAGKKIHCFITSKEHLLKIFPMGEKCVSWKMTPKWLEKYADDPDIKYFSFDHDTPKWW